jgi:peptide deformylase
MAIRPIIEVPDPRLKLVSKPVETFDAALAALVADMFETMYAAPGIGLAAIQVGVPLRVLVIDLQEPGADGEPVRTPRVFINPQILEASAETAVYNEGCLSVPDIYADVDRPARVRARWQDVEGQSHEAELDGLLATCLQHEIDHLDGVVFLDHLSRLKREMLLKKLAKARREKVAA